MATTEQTVAGADSGKKEETNMENAHVYSPDAGTFHVESVPKRV